jgi:hypothetical protein
MDGSGIDFVVIPIVVLPIIAFWLYGMYYADSHPRWLSGPSGQREVTAATVPAARAVPAVPPQVPGVILPSVVVEDSAAPAVADAP